VSRQRHLAQLPWQRQPLRRRPQRLGRKQRHPAPCLRHACGFALTDHGANTSLIEDYLGHCKIQHTVRYIATNPARFEKLWR
jgi:integrase